VLDKMPTEYDMQYAGPWMKSFVEGGTGTNKMVYPRIDGKHTLADNVFLPRIDFRDSFADTPLAEISTRPSPDTGNRWLVTGDTTNVNGTGAMAFTITGANGWNYAMTPLKAVKKTIKACIQHTGIAGVQGVSVAFRFNSGGVEGWRVYCNHDGSTGYTLSLQKMNTSTFQMEDQVTPVVQLGSNADFRTVSQVLTIIDDPATGTILAWLGNDWSYSVTATSALHATNTYAGAYQSNQSGDADGDVTKAFIYELMCKYD
jgi:hypothetical protein